MNTKIIAAIIAIIILLGIGGYLFLGKNTTSQTQPASPTQTKQENLSNSLLDLLNSGKTQKCDFSYKAEDGVSTKGTLYLTDAKMRGDITTISKDNKTTRIYMIRNGDTTYIWGDSIQGGIKMTLSAQDLQTNNQAIQYFNTKEKAQYSCGAWVVDNSVFNVPANVKFLDVSAIMPKTTGTTGTPNSQSACAGIADPTTRASCENAMRQKGY